VAVKLYDEAREPTLPPEIKLPTVAQAEKELKLPDYEKRFFSAMQKSILMKCMRKDAASHSMHAIRKAIEEVGKRTGFSFEQLEFATYEELSLAFLQQLDKSELEKRREYCISIAETLPLKTFSGEIARQEAKKRMKNTSHVQVNEIKGTCACPGTAKGKAKIVIRPNDLVKIEKGDVLVTTATIPEMVPVMKKASAIITDQGGITSHASIVARELQIPCLIGTKIATKVFKDGDLVEVDATNGTARKV
jgi:phosphoenolpyruvate synthase/pyruvate phosphate dikinase